VATILSARRPELEMIDDYVGHNRPHERN